MDYKEMTGKDKQIELREQLSECMGLHDKDIKAVSDETGIDRSTLGRWLRGIGSMRFNKLYKIEQWIKEYKDKI